MHCTTLPLCSQSEDRLDYVFPGDRFKACFNIPVGPYTDKKGRKGRIPNCCSITTRFSSHCLPRFWIRWACHPKPESIPSDLNGTRNPQHRLRLMPGCEPRQNARSRLIDPLLQLHWHRLAARGFGGAGPKFIFCP